MIIMNIRRAVCFGIFLFTFCAPPLVASETAAPEIPLYQGAAPGSESWKLPEEEFVMRGSKVLRNVVNPRLTVFTPPREKNNGSAVIVAPGGGMMYLSIENEGYAVARWFAARGFTAFVLKYRTAQMSEPDAEFYSATIKQLMRAFSQPPQTGAVIDSVFARVTPLALADGVQAIRKVRSLGGAFGYASNRIVMLGFSAGGRIAIGGAFQAAQADCPDYTGWIYSGLFERAISAPIEVPKNVPPVFMAAATNDPLFGAVEKPFYLAMLNSGSRVELHLFANGGHGFGMAESGHTSDHWVDEFYWWLESYGLTKKPELTVPAG